MATTRSQGIATIEPAEGGGFLSCSPADVLLVTPLGRPLGSNYGDPFGGRGVLGRGRDQGATGR